MFSFCEVSGYVWNSFVYTGKDLFADTDELERDFSSIDIEAIRTGFIFFFSHEKNYKHLKHKQKASK